MIIFKDCHLLQDVYKKVSGKPLYHSYMDFSILGEKHLLYVRCEAVLYHDCGLLKVMPAVVYWHVAAPPQL